MIVAIGHFEWQVLRVLVRAETARKAPPTGRDLRLIPTRRTKDGTFLDGLIAAGLIEVATGPTPPTEDDGRDEPAQFRTRYRLTTSGRHAAEYGEYDRPFTPATKPVTGLVAELAETTRRFTPKESQSKSTAPGKRRKA